MAAPKTYQEYRKRMSNAALSVLSVASKVQKDDKYALRVAQQRQLIDNVNLTYIGGFPLICKPVLGEDDRGNVWDYDESWLTYATSPDEYREGWFTKYIFPRDFFLATQIYVATALNNKPAGTASVRDKALWAIDVMSNINQGLLATNLGSEVLGDLTLINQINSIQRYVDFDGIESGLRKDYGRHQLWTYADNIFNKNINRYNPPETIAVCPLLCAEFSDLFLPSAIMSSAALTNLYGASHSLVAGCKGQDNKVPYPSSSWQYSAKYVTQYLPWSLTVDKTLDFIHECIFGSVVLRIANTKAYEAFGLGTAYTQWMLMNIHRTYSWYLGTKWYGPDSAKIPFTRRFIALNTFLTSLSTSPKLVDTKLADRSVKMPNFIYMYNNGVVDAWAKYFIQLKYKAYIEAGIQMWADQLKNNRTTTPYEMNEAIDQVRAPSTNTLGMDLIAAATNMGVNYGASIIKSFSHAVIENGLETGFSFPSLSNINIASVASSFGATAVLGVVTGFFSFLVGKKKAARERAARIRAYKQKVLNEYSVVTQLFRRVINYRVRASDGAYFSTSTGEWLLERGATNASGAVNHVAEAIPRLLAKIPDDDLPPVVVADTIQLAPMSNEKEVLAELSKVVSDKYAPDKPNLFQNSKTNQLIWVADALAEKLKSDVQFADWSFIRRGGIAIVLQPAQTTTNRKRVLAVAATSTVAALVWIFGLL